MSPAWTVAAFPVGVLLQPAVARGSAASAPAIATVAMRCSVLMGEEPSTRRTAFGQAGASPQCGVGAGERARRLAPSGVFLLGEGRRPRSEEAGRGCVALLDPAA